VKTNKKHLKSIRKDWEDFLIQKESKKKQKRSDEKNKKRID